MTSLKLPYPARYVVAVVAWLVFVAGDLLLRLLFLAFLPIVWVRSWQSQSNAQLMANVSDFYVRPLLRLPRYRRPRSANRRPALLQEVSNDRA